MRNAPVLFTQQLVLRLPEPQDFDVYAAMMADAGTMAHLGGAMSRALAWRDFTVRAGGWLTRGFSTFSVIERASGAFVGRVGPWEPEGWPAPEIGWALAPGYAGRGYAAQAAVAAIDYVVDLLGWNEVAHAIAPDNVRSIRLAERLGAAHCGPTRLPPPLESYRCDLWGQSAAAWRARRSAGAGA